MVTVLSPSLTAVLIFLPFSSAVKGKIAFHPKKEAMKKNHRLVQIPNCLCPIP
jgi:hypothetical protein